MRTEGFRRTLDVSTAINDGQKRNVKTPKTSPKIKGGKNRTARF